jgi:D-glycero-D-manno-heptose 1,7-bisphosphate phosphatase
MSRVAVFFDRDGVVNVSPGPGYVLSVEEFHLSEGIAEALQVVHEHQALAIVVTSQKGVGKGLMPRAELDRIHEHMQSHLRMCGASFDGIYAYTGEPECPYQAKPDPDMILRAAADFDIDLSRSWMIGDADRDIEMGHAAGLKGTIRIAGEKQQGTVANHTLFSPLEIADLLRKIL